MEDSQLSCTRQSGATGISTYGRNKSSIASKTQVSRTEWFYARVVDSLFLHLQPDNNAQQAIEATLRGLNTMIPPQHVKGHQDANKNYKLRELSNKMTQHGLQWETQLNIIADKLDHIAK
eukprot:15330674-Ditylum_brightwellii.AAC.1